MTQQKPQFNYQNKRYLHQQLTQTTNHSDSFFFHHFEKQKIHYPNPDSIFPFLNSQFIQNLPVFTSQTLCSQYSQNIGLSQLSPAYPLISNALFYPLINSFPQFQKIHCDIRASLGQGNIFQGQNHLGPQFKNRESKNSLKASLLKMQEREVAIPVSLTRSHGINFFSKKSYQSQSCLHETGESMSRRERVKRYLLKKERRTFEKRIVYQCRKSVADNRERVKGRFVKRMRKNCEVIQNKQN